VSFPAISVIIPVKNEALKIRDCIDGILSQSVPVSEIIVIDSGSTDGTVEILKSYPQVKLIEIPGSEFNHGSTRNLGVQKAIGEYVLLTVGDARPYNQFWIEELLNGFVDDEVAGVCGQQVVSHDVDKNPVEWFSPIAKPELIRYKFKSVIEFESLPPGEKIKVCGWDDVNAMYRRDILLKIPFPKTSYAEDLLWCKSAVLNGHAIVYNYASRVYHYHLETSDFSYKRTFTVLFYRYKAFGFIPEELSYSLRSWFSMIKLLLFNTSLDFTKKIYWLKYNLGNRKAIRKATKDFIEWQKKGELYLDSQHEKLCGKPPIPLKKNNI